MESYVAHQMLETCGQILDGINNHPLSMTVDSFWDVLLSKPHRFDFRVFPLRDAAGSWMCRMQG